MGRNKGKGSAKLRRINSEKKQKKIFDNHYNKIKSYGFPDVTFNKIPSYFINIV